MKYPIVLLEGNDVTMFATATDLSGYIEAIDVRAGVYYAFDSEGSPLELTVDSTGLVHAADRVGADSEPRKLAEALMRYLTVVEASPVADSWTSVSLSELVAAALPLAAEPRKS